MPAPRRLLVTADDFGIGPETSRGILDLAARGAVTSTVLLAHSPFAADAVAAWTAAGRPLEVGWHPCLTLDRPLLPPEAVPSLVQADGRFPPLGRFLKRVVLGRIDGREVEAEFRAQLRRFLELVGRPPANVNAHHHVHVFRVVGDALARVLEDVRPRPFVRRVVEPAGAVRRVPGARLKRLFLDRLGRRAARRQAAAGLPGNDTLVGITDPPFVHRPDFFERWLSVASGDFVELSCHPGRLDTTLDGRDGSLTDGQLHRRAKEYERLADPAFLDAVRTAGFRLVTAAELAGHPATRAA